jgi:hypothetical protein
MGNPTFTITLTIETREKLEKIKNQKNAELNPKKPISVNQLINEAIQEYWFKNQTDNTTKIKNLTKQQESKQKNFTTKRV